MTYEETLHDLYTRAPAFHRAGASAYKPGLDTSWALDRQLGNPSAAYRSIHVAGTNGKGSVCHLLAAVLQEAGYKVGLFTSPHLLDFRERIRVNGAMIPEAYVTGFVERNRLFWEQLHPSFFELTSSMAFAYFRDQRVDLAVIETGLGGRLDSTNILTPILSVITNVSLDHVQFLGDTVEAIAAEKAGIIKPHIPALLGEAEKKSVYTIFSEKARRLEVPFFYAPEMSLIDPTNIRREANHWIIPSREYGELEDELGGEVQRTNANTVLCALHILRKRQGIAVSAKAVREGFRHVTTQTGLMGRWQRLRTQPAVICDTGHNTGAWESLGQQLAAAQAAYRKIRVVFGMVHDKDIEGVLALMPRLDVFYFTQASIPRALPVEVLQEKAKTHGLAGEAYPTVRKAVEVALAEADPEDMIFIGGSTFVVAEALPLFSEDKMNT